MAVGLIKIFSAPLIWVVGGIPMIMLFFGEARKGFRDSICV